MMDGWRNWRNHAEMSLAVLAGQQACTDEISAQANLNQMADGGTSELRRTTTGSARGRQGTARTWAFICGDPTDKKNMATHSRCCLAETAGQRPQTRCRGRTGRQSSAATNMVARAGVAKDRYNARPGPDFIRAFWIRVAQAWAEHRLHTAAVDQGAGCKTSSTATFQPIMGAPAEPHPSGLPGGRLRHHSR